MKSRRLAVLLVGGAAVIGALAVSVGNATAASNGACVLSGTAFFSPGLGATAQSESYTFSGSFSHCEGVTGITNGTVSASGSGSLGCANGSSSGTATIDWNDGTTSAVSFTTTSAAAATVVQGTVTSGTFAGEKAKAAIVFSTTTPQDCAAGGLPSANFDGPAEIGT